MGIQRLIAVIVLVCFSIGFPVATGADRPSKIEHGIYSRDAVFVCGAQPAPPIRIPSPDGKKSMVGKSSQGTDRPRSSLIVEAFSQQFEVGFTWSPNCEVAWSPDSRAFFATYTMGGAVGTFVTQIFFVHPEGLELVEPTQDVMRDFMSRPHFCYWDEEPNIGGVTWLSDSSRLLVAAEFLPHSNCEEMGMFRAYEITVPDGRIVKEYDQRSAKKLFWPHLGDELRGADDECLKKPRFCETEAIKLGRKRFTK